MRLPFFTAMLCVAFATNNATSQVIMKKQAYVWPDVAPPVAEMKPHFMTAHDDVRQDDYYWMSDYFTKGPDSTKVVDYLKAENSYFDKMMAATEGLQQKLFEEMKRRIKEKDESVPYLDNGYYYYYRMEDGKNYFLFCRKEGTLEAKEEVLLNVNEMAEGHTYYAAAGFSVSPNNKILAYGIDTMSRREYEIRFRNLETGKDFDYVIKGTTGRAIWANDNTTLFYTAKNPVTLLSEKIMKHKLGDEVKNDLIVYEEKDPTNYIGLDKTKSKQFILISSQGTLSSEYLYLDANKADNSFKVFQPRLKDVLYNINHAGDSFYIYTNYQARNFKIMVTPTHFTRIDNWVDYVPHNDKILIEGFELFKDYLVIEERKDGLTQIHIKNTNNGDEHFLSFDDPAYSAGLDNNPGYDTRLLRFNYTSLTTPATVFDYDMDSRKKTMLKQQAVLGDFSPDNYLSERAYATASDGTKVPISIVYRKGFNKDGNAPLLLYGYGSYGVSMDASFSSVRLSLLDRGFGFAIAHIRGGQEMGRYWYEDGKMMKKKNTFTDFISCAEFLLANKYTSKAHLYASGGSAGGLLMGAVVNMRPDLWNGVIAAVPFVDVVTTMSDPTIPLTTNEYDEWGNPENKESYFYMKSYSPYDNVAPKAYPNLLITTGLHDSQVQYFEPAKWIAKLRRANTSKNVLLLHTDMSVGHGGASGRFNALKDSARNYAFLFALEGIAE